MHNNQKKWGLLTGYSVVLMALVAGFVYGFVHSTIYKAGDSDLTARLLQENIAMYKWGIVSWILIFVLDIIVSLGLYIIYKAEQKKISNIIICSKSSLHTNSRNCCCSTYNPLD